MITRSRPAILLSVAAVTLAAMTATARGADGSPQSDPPQLAVSPQPSESAQQLKEVIVTAQRRAQNIQNVPISMAALSQRTLTQLHIESLTQLESVTPGLVFTSPTAFDPTGGADVAIRGIFSGGEGAAPTTQIYIDDTPIEQDLVGISGVFSNPNPEIFDLERVEVLRGPQGTLFGASAMGGAVRFITPQPSLTEASGYTQGEMAYSPYGAPSYNLGIAYGAPVVKGVAGFRISAYYNYEGGYISEENPITGQLLATNVNTRTSYALRPALTIAPLRGLTITLSDFLEHISQANPPIYWLTLLPVPKPDGQQAEGLTLPQPYTEDLNVPALTIKYDLPALTIESNTSSLFRRFYFNENMTNADQYFLTGSDFFPGVPLSDSWYWTNEEWTSSVQEELRFESNDKPGQRLHWIFGLFYSEAHEHPTQVLPGDLNAITEACCGLTETQFFGFGQYIGPDNQTYNGYNVYNNTETEKASYANISYDFTPRLTVAAGVRVSDDTVTSNQLLTGALNGNPPPWGVVYLKPQKETPVTPRFSVSYHFADNSMVYTTIAKGYRLGGTQPVKIFQSPACQPSLKQLPGVYPAPTYNSDSLWSYEVGVKSTLVGRLQVDASAYHIDWSNIQTVVPVASCLFAFVANFGKAYSNGGDIQLEAALSDHLTLGASGGYTDAYYGKNEVVGQSVLAQNGEPLPNVPPWTVTVNAAYRGALPFWSDTDGYFRVDFRHISAMHPLDPVVRTYDPALGLRQDPAYSTLNLRVGVVYNNLDASVFVDNATNANPLLGYDHYAPGDPLFQAAQIRPLTTGITLRYNF